LKEYFGKHPSLTENMRKILVDWLVDVHRKFKLRHETLFMAINLIDRYMEAAAEPMQKNKFQLFGVTCLFIASKYEEIYPPSLSDFVYVCADTYTAEMVLEMEGVVVYSSSLQILGVYSQQRRPILNFRQTWRARKESGPLHAHSESLGLQNLQPGMG
jgi:Cyclin, N-terminal domain